MLAGRSRSFLPFCFWCAAFLPHPSGRSGDIGAAFCRCAILCVLTLNFIACSGTQTYYKNRFFTDNGQQRLNIDLSYCELFARQRYDFRLKDICLAEKGWIEISKEEYIRLIQGH